MTWWSRVRAFRALRTLLCVPGILGATSGCYTYQPIALTGIAPGSTVRTELTAQGMIRLEDFFSEPRRTIVGEVVDSDNGGIILVTRTGMTSVNRGAPLPLRQRIAVQNQEIAALEERVLDRNRTIGLSGAVALTSGIVIRHFMSAGSRGQRSQPVPPGPEPSISIRIPFSGLFGGGSR